MSLTWSGEHYADHTAHHRAHDDLLLARIAPLADDATVLDVGCGVGDFTVQLLDRVPHGQVLGIDADPSMIATARSGHGSRARLRFEVLRAQSIAAAAPAASIDAIVSTACLHWVPEQDHPSVLVGARQLLVPGGQWCVEFGGAGQLAALRRVLDPLAREFGGSGPVWFFPEAAQYAALLRDAGFLDVQVELVHQRRPMADAAALRGLLTSQVLVGYLPSIPEDRRPEFVDAACTAVVADVERRSDRLAVDDQVDDEVDYGVDYVRVVASARAPR